MQIVTVTQDLAYWVHWAQDRDRWRALMNTVIKLQFAQRSGKILDYWRSV